MNRRNFLGSLAAASAVGFSLKDIAAREVSTLSEHV